MAALTLTAANTYVIEDNASHHEVRLSYFANTTTNETSGLKVNVDTLIGRTMLMTFSGINAGPSLGGDLFVPGSTITANGGSNAIGYFLEYTNPNANTFRVVLANNTLFANGDVLYDDRFGHIVVVGNAVSEPARVTVAGILWSIPGSARVGLEWANANTSLNDEFFVMSGSGSFGKNTFNAPLQCTTANSTGNINLSTYGILANGGYTIILDLRKGQGFGARPVY